MTCEQSPAQNNYPIREAFRIFLPPYMKKHHLSEEQEHAGLCISHCKTGALGYTKSVCSECGYEEIHYTSCNNRHCPCCQRPLEQKWVSQRNSEIIPGIAYYHVIFTVPYELNDLIEANPNELLGLMFDAVSKTLLTLCADPKWLGAKPGIVSVLHTWGQKLNYHPHIHTIVSGGGLTKDGQFVEGTHKGFLIPADIVASVFRGKYLDGLKSLYKKGKLTFPEKLSGLRNHFEWKEYIDSLYAKKWLPFLKETFNGNGSVVQYLARYAYRTAISNNRIVSVDNESVTFRYKDYADQNKQKTLTMDGEEFVGAFLRHILPAGFQRVRFSGYLSNSVKKKNLTLISRLRNHVYNGDPTKGKSIQDLLLNLFGFDICACPMCKGEMIPISSKTVRKKRGTLKYVVPPTATAN